MVETRKCIVSSQIDWLTQKPKWAGLKTIAMIEETRETKHKTSVERCFFISSLAADAKKCFKETGIKTLRKKAGWGNSTLELILRQNF